MPAIMPSAVAASDLDVGAEEQPQIVDGERVQPFEPCADFHAPIVKPQRQHAVLLEPIGRQRAGERLDVEQLARQVRRDDR
jgi:hypothetical protein